MTLSDLASVATVLSSIAVFGSLIYVGYQTRQNTRHTRALIQLARNQQIIDMNMTVVTNPTVNEILQRGDAGDRTLTPAEVSAYVEFTMAQLAHAENSFYQHREGLIDDELNFGSEAFIRLVRAVSPGFRATWLLVRPLYGPEFRNFIDEKIRAAAPLSAADTSVRWFSFVAKETERPKGH